MQVDFSDIMNKYLEIDGDDTLKRKHEWAA